MEGGIGIIHQCISSSPRSLFQCEANYLANYRNGLVATNSRS